MATSLPQRRPLSSRFLQGPSQPSPAKQVRVVSGSKRPRSPDHGDAPHTKRVRAITQDSATSRNLNKERKNAEREAEFKQKYTRAFPGWIFYLDSETLAKNVEHTFRAKILHLGGKIEPFFSSSITHLITDRAPPSNPAIDKENTMQTTKSVAGKSGHGLRSPIKIMGRGGEEVVAYDVVTKACEYGIKIWSQAKLDSVLSRCIVTPSSTTLVKSRFSGVPSAPQRSLSRLLQTEKIHGTTERDPTQKRHDFRYFSRGTCFVLLEDIYQELATIAAHEYAVSKEKDKSGKKPWPVLHCHPQSRNPFAPFDDKEKRRWERAQQAEKTEDADRARRKKKQLEAMKRKAESQVHVKTAGDLRRSLSLSNLHRRLSHPVGTRDVGFIDLDADLDEAESANASGYFASGAGMGYIAASGNSVGITSTTGTTSTSGKTLRNLSLPTAITDRMKQEVLTSRKFPTKAKDEYTENAGVMGPPSQVPNRPNKQAFLKKSKSMNTLKLPKREEGVKPGYCESCRVKFSDFTTHTDSSKHRKFASNAANFQGLDAVLGRIKRRTLQEMYNIEARRGRNLHAQCKRNPHEIRSLKELSSP